MRSGRCPKCEGTEIILANPAEYGDNSMEVGPMSVTAEPRWMMNGRNPKYAKGELVLYVCRSCGFAEWYAIEPESIPIGKEFRTELLEPNPAASKAAAPPADPAPAAPPESREREAGARNAVSDVQLGELDALYKEGTDQAWTSLFDELRKLRRVVEMGIVVDVAGSTLSDAQTFYDWAHERYPLIEGDTNPGWIGVDLRS